MKKLIFSFTFLILITFQAEAQTLYDTQPGKKVPYTAAQVSARKAQEKAWLKDKPVRDARQRYIELKSKINAMTPDVTIALASGKTAPVEFTDAVKELSYVEQIITSLGGEVP